MSARGRVRSTDWITRLALQPHPEGGWYRRIHADATEVETAYGPRARCTSIQYLLSRAQPIGRLHRNRAGILHFLQDSGPVEYLTLDAEGRLMRTVLGSGANEPQFLFVAGGTWKGARLIGEADQALG